MYYKQLTEKKKVEIDILLKQNLSMREVGRRLNISHSTISRYKSNFYYHKRKIDIYVKYPVFIKYLHDHYDHKIKSIEVCHHIFHKNYPGAPHVSVKQIYNWIHQGKLKFNDNDLCYK